MSTSLRTLVPSSAALACAAVALLAGAPSQAQQVSQAASAGGLEEIVVTARRREENLQSVPIAITAFTQEDLENKRAFQLRDVVAFTPSMNMNQNASDAFTPFSTNLILRGLPGAVTYFSQVPTGSAGVGGLAGATAVPGHYMDLALLEVDKGPQGTLFGTNAIGGAILLEPKRPTNEVEGFLQGGFGNYSSREANGVFNAPVIKDKLMVRVAGQVIKREGYTRLLNSSIDLDGRNYQSWRAGVTFKPTEEIDNYLVYDGYHQRQNGSSAILDFITPGGFVARFFPQMQALLAQQQALGPRVQVSRSSPAYSLAKVWGITDVFTWNIADDLTLKNVAAIRRSRFKAPVDMDGTAFPILDVGPANATQLGLGWSTSNRQYTEELQLQGRSFDNDLSWTVGAFLLFADAPDPNYGLSTALGSTSPTVSANSNRSRALYAQGVYDLHKMVEGLRFTAGIRYNWDRVSNEQRATSASGACSNVAFSDANCVQHADAKFKAPGWTLGLDYQVEPGTLVYVRAGHAYLAGFANLSAPSPAFSRVDPQKATDVEIGVKTDFEIGSMRGRVNADVFRTWFDDIAVSKLVTFTNAAGSIVTNNATVNAAKSSVKGVELEGAMVPVDGLSLNGFASYVYTSYSDYPTDTFGRGAPAIMYVPRWKYGIGGTYTLPLDQKLGDISFSVNYVWTGSQYVSADVHAFNQLPSWDKLDLRIVWENINGYPIDIAGYMTNATDNTYRAGRYPLVAQLGFDSSTWAEPRMYGVQFKFKFGPGL